MNGRMAESAEQHDPIEQARANWERAGWGGVAAGHGRRDLGDAGPSDLAGPGGERAAALRPELLAVRAAAPSCVQPQRRATDHEGLGPAAGPRHQRHSRDPPPGGQRTGAAPAASDRRAHHPGGDHRAGALDGRGRDRRPSTRRCSPMSGCRRRSHARWCRPSRRCGTAPATSEPRAPIARKRRVGRLGRVHHQVCVRSRRGRRGQAWRRMSMIALKSRSAWASAANAAYISAAWVPSGAVDTGRRHGRHRQPEVLVHQRGRESRPEVVVGRRRRNRSGHRTVGVH